MSRLPVIPIAFGLVFLFLALLLPVLWIDLALGTLGAGLLIGSLVWRGVEKHRDRYNLDDLRVLHESGGPTPDIDDVPDVDPDATAFCPSCGQPYDSWLPKCPHCRC